MDSDSKKIKIVFFVKKNMDRFLNDIVSQLSIEYETQKIIVTDYKQIDEGMKLADVCWFEWCDELVIHASRLPIAKDRKIICRLHSYEAFAEYPSRVNWDAVDKLVFVASSIRNYVVNKYKIGLEKTLVIPNGVDLNRYTFKERKHGFKIAYAGFINYKKGPMLLIHTFKSMFDLDARYKLHIAGAFQDARDILYFKQMAGEWNLRDNILYYGWQNDLNSWLEDKNYILCTSILESQNISVMQAMSKGIKPIIHNFVGAGGIYPKKYLFNSIGEAVEKLTGAYDSLEYRKFIEDNYSLAKQESSVKGMMSKLVSSTKEKPVAAAQEFDYIKYWDYRYRNGGTSGDGSYGLLAEFKAEVINSFIKENGIKSVIEFGCGDGNQLSMMNYNKYVGLDVSKVSVETCKTLFREDADKSFYLYRPGFLDLAGPNPDMVVCLDVLYHIIDENDFIKTLDDIFKLSPRYVIIYTMLKEPKIVLAKHLKFRNVFPYLEKYKEYSVADRINQKYPERSFSDFLILKRNKV